MNKLAQSMILAALVVVLLYTIASTYQQLPKKSANYEEASGLHLISAPKLLKQHGIIQQPAKTVQNNSTESVRERFAIMFDAGSTGTRIHVLKFRQEIDGNSLQVVSEYFEQVKPGLSSYADEPSKGVASLERLVEMAQKRVPSEMMQDTPIALKATAGLRLLPSDSANQLLNKVMEYFRKTPFKVTPNCASIMDGISEGFFLWFTVNLLKGTLGSSQLDVLNTVGTLDLGGGSTQITFLPYKHSTLESTPTGFVKTVGLFSRRYEAYSHSYLGLGLKSARLKIMGAPDISSINSGKDDSNDEYQLVSQCLPGSYRGQLEHAAITFRVAGNSSQPSSQRFRTCYEIAKKIVGKVDRPAEVKSTKFYAFSYYINIAVDAGLIELYQSKEVTIKIRDYYEAAQRECQRPNIINPFLCIDLTFISALLKDGFGFEDNTELVVTKKYKGIEMSWALGAAFSTLDSKQLDTHTLL